MTIKSLLTRIIPEDLAEFIRFCRLRGTRRHCELLLRFDRLRKKARDSKRLTPGQFAFPGLPQFAIHPEAVEAFEYFVFRDADATCEMDEFIELTRDKKCLLDIGAHYGAFGLAFTVGRQATGLAVEPSPKALSILEWHAENNPGLDIRVRPIALSSKAGILTMRYAWTHLVQSGAALADGEREITVPCMTVDTFLAQEGVKPDCIKLDVEGDEWNVLQGAQSYLKEHGPVLFLEVHPVILQPQGHSVGEICRFLRDMGYSIYGNRRLLRGDPEQFTRGAVTRLVCRK